MNKRDLLKKIYNLKNNIIVSGRINSRKTYGVMFPLTELLIENNESFFVLDSKEEYVRRFYNTLQDRGYETVVINLRDSLRSDGWNPLTYAYSLYKNNRIDEATRSVEKIASILFNVESDRFWVTTSKNLFLGLVWFLFENVEEEQINFNSIVELLNMFEEKEYLFENLEGLDCRSANLLAPVVKMPKDTKGSVVSIVRQELTKFTNYPNLAKMLATPMKELHLDHKFAIFFINRDEDLYFNSLSAVFIDQFYDFLMKKRYDLSFNFILDNFETIEKDYPSLDILLSSGPSRKVRTIIGSPVAINAYDAVSEHIASSEEDVIFNMNGEETIAPNDYERVDLNEIIKLPTLNAKDIKVFKVDENKEIEDDNIQELTKKIDEEIAKLNEQLHDDIPDDKDEINDIIRQIDEEIAYLEKKNGIQEVVRVRNSFEDFLANNNFDDIKENVVREEEDRDIKALVDEIEEEIKKLDEELNDDIPDDEEEINEIIRKIDEEIKRLEKEDNTSEVKEVRNSFTDFLEKNDFSDIKDQVVEEDKELKELIKKIDDEIKKLDEELNDDIPDDEDEITRIVNEIEEQIAKLEEENEDDKDVKEVRNNFMEFLDKNDFDEVVEDVKAADMKYYDFEELINSIDKEIALLEKNEAREDSKNDFEEFLEDNNMSDLVENIKKDEFANENITYEQLIEALDKEIEALENKVNEDNYEDFDDIIKRLDDEIATLEEEENVDTEEIRDNYDELIKKIDEEINRLTQEQQEEKKNGFDFDEIERVNRDIEEYSKNNEAKVIEIE